MPDEEILKREWKEKSTELLLGIHEEMRNIVDGFNKSLDTSSKIDEDAFVQYAVEWLKVIEGIAVLFKEGLVDVAQVLTRSLFEITLQLCYLISDEQEIENKAACYYVASNMQAYWLNKKRCANMKQLNFDSNEGEKKNEKIINSLKNSNISSINKGYKYIAHEKLINADWNNISWYELYDMIHAKNIKVPRNRKIKISNRQFCKRLEFYDDKDNKVLIYDIIYAELSRQAHGFSAIDQMKYFEGVQYFRRSDCLQNGLWQIKMINEMFKKIVVKIPNIYKSFKLDKNNDKDRELASRFLARKNLLDDLKIKLDMLYKS